MRKAILILFLAGLSFLYLISCDGGDGKSEEEFTVFDVTISVLEVEFQIGSTDCPDTADLKLSLFINGNEISGFAELLGLGKIGDARAISGLIEENEFTLEPFRVSVSGDVPPDAFFPASSILFDFQQFQGVFIDEDGVLDRMEGEVSGTVFENTGDVVICFDAEFTGEFSGIARSPKGCVSRLEIPTLECPAEGFVNQCNQYDFYFCSGFCEPFNGGTICFDFEFNASECGIIDCATLTCPSVGTIHLEEEGGFMFVRDDHILHCG